MKSFRCRDVGVDCDAQLVAENKEALIEKVKTHAREEHNIPKITPELLARIEAAIRDEAEVLTRSSAPSGAA